MSAFQKFIRNHFIASLLGLTAVGFLVVLADLALAGHRVGIQQVGLFATILGFLLTIHGILAPSAARKLAIAFLALALFGLFGAYEHHETTIIKTDMTHIQQQMLGQSAENMLALGPPPLAPLSLSGLAIFALLLLLAGEPSNEPEPTQSA